MTGPSPHRRAVAGERVEELLDALLYSVSHDLRSPLLTLSLSGQLLRESATPELRERAGPVLEGLQAAATDLERMLQALTVLSRARRRTLDCGPVALGLALDGRALPEHASQVEVRTDAAVLREFALWAAGSAEAHGASGFHAEPDGQSVTVRVPSPALPAFEGTPLGALALSLQQYAGSPLERLAAFQVLFERQDASITVEGETLVLQVPRAAGHAEDGE